MGCASSRTEEEPAEALLIQSENKLGYLQHDTKMIDMEFGKFKNAGLIPASQVEKFAAKMRLPFANAPHVPNTEQFYSHFKQGDGYAYVTMNVLVILLSTGPGTEKIKLLFESHDPEHKREMSRDNFLRLVSVMVAIAVLYLPDFLDFNALSLAEKGEAAKYIARLKKKQFTSVSAVANRLCGRDGHSPETICVSDLQEMARDPSIGALTSASGIRRFVRAFDEFK